MGLIPATLIIGVLTILITRGSLRQLGRTQFESLWALIVAVIVQVPLGYVDFSGVGHDIGFVVLMLTYALLLGFCFVNLHIRGVWLVAIGIALNAFVIGLNQGMPYRPVSHSKLAHSIKNRPERHGDLVMPLADVIVTPQPIPGYVSIGDFVLCGGLLFVIVGNSHKKRSRVKAPVQHKEIVLEPEREKTLAASALPKVATAAVARATQRARARIKRSQTLWLPDVDLAGAEEAENTEAPARR